VKMVKMKIHNGENFKHIECYFYGVPLFCFTPSHTAFVQCLHVVTCEDNY